MGDNGGVEALQNAGLVNMANPLFLSSGDNPSLVLVSPVLSGDNFHTWKRAMRVALSSKNKLGFLDGSIPKPPVGNNNRTLWVLCNDMVVSWITRSVCPTIAQSIMFYDTAKEMWDDLNERYGKGDAYRISDITDEVNAAKQGSMTITEYFTKLKTLWDQMDVLDPMPECICHALPQYKEKLERGKVIRFLKGLNEEYANVATQILMIKPLPSTREAFNMALTQERKINHDVSVGIFSARVSGTHGGFQISQGNSQNSRNSYSQPNYGASQSQQNSGFNQGFKKFNGNNKKPVCTYCGMTGHTVDRCYKKHGFPPGFKGRDRAAGQFVAANQAYIEEADQDDQIHAAMHQSSSASSGGSGGISTGISQAQYDNIMQLLQNAQIHSQQHTEPDDSPAVMSAKVEQSNPGSFNFDDDWIS